MLRVTLGQINPTIGDIDGNLELMDRAAHLAFREGSNVIVFPELSLTGYYPADLLEEESFRTRIRDGIERLQALSRRMPDVHWVLGREVIPQSIIDKPPSAELAPNQLDTDSLPPCEILDEILKVLIEGSRLARAERASAESAVAHLRETAVGRDTIARVQKMISRSEYKRRQAAPIIRMRARAFGIGRQMPIAARY